MKVIYNNLIPFKGYNGPGYKDNNYDQKLRNTYENFKDKL